MECYSCGATLSENSFCNACGADVGKYKKIMYAANRCYNEGLERAGVRDLSGAIQSLRECLKLNKNHIDARNLLGLIYFETGEAVAGISEWVISKNIRPEKNIADDFIERIQSNQSRLETITSTIRKYNKALDLCYQESNDLAVIQLKKVLSMNPKYVQAHQLLALLFMERGDYEKAYKELNRCLSIDKGNLTTLRYMKEVETILNPTDDKKKTGRGIFEEGSAKTFKNGNEVIIQPLNEREPLGISAFIQIGIGILIGLCITYFLIVPARVQTAKDQMSASINEYGETIDKKNTEINELENRVAELEQTGINLQNQIDVYEGTNGAVDANNYLIGAALAYIDPLQDNTNVVEYLDLIGEDYVEQNASFEFKELYNYLMGDIGETVADNYYESGLEYYNAGDYNSAVRALEKAYAYNRNSDNALYYLALSYYESGDMAQANEKFNELITAFPTSSLVDKARQRIAEMGY